MSGRGRGCTPPRSTRCGHRVGPRRRRRGWPTTPSLAGRPADAQRWATAAGDDALAGLAAEEAVGWYRRALDHARCARSADVGAGRPHRSPRRCRHPGRRPHRARHPARGRRARRALRQRRGAAACGAGDESRLVHPVRQCRRPRSSPPPRPRWRVPADADLATRARLEAVVAQSLVHTDQTERRTAAAEAALEMAHTSGDPTVVARVAPAVIMALWAPGTAAARAAIAAEAVEIVETVGDPNLTAAVYYAAHTAAVCAGDAAATQRCRTRLRAIADEVDRAARPLARRDRRRIHRHHDLSLPGRRAADRRDVRDR